VTQSAVNSFLWLYLALSAVAAIGCNEGWLPATGP
jgi:hypothetical protein